jgi:hypothetical protein
VRKAKGMDFISSTPHVCIQGENEISEIKRHHTKKAFQFLFALESKKRLDRKCSIYRFIHYTSSRFVLIIFFIFRMKLVLASIVLCAAIYVASATKLLASSSRQLNYRETNLLKRLVKRQAYNGENFQGIFD